MARKLSSQERENINFITDVLLHALPAAQRNFAGSLASALVRVQGDQITDADLERVTAKYGEFQSALIEMAKAKVLDRVPAVDAEGDGEAFTLRVPEAAATTDEAAEGAAASAEKGAEPAETAGAPEEPKKPVRKRRSRKKKAEEAATEAEVTEAAVGEAPSEPEAAAESAAEASAEEPAEESVEKPKSVRPGRGARAAKAKSAAAKRGKKAKAEKPVAEPVAAEPAESVPVVREAVGPKPEEPAAEVAAAETAAAAAAEGTEPVPAEEKPRRRTRRRRTKKPAIEEVVVTGSEAEALLAKEEAAVEAEAGAVTEEAAPVATASAEKADAVNEPQVEVPAAKPESVTENATPEQEAPTTPTAEAESGAPAEEKPAKPSGRARVRGRGRRGFERRQRGDNLSDVPYVRRGGETETALREEIVRLDPRLWMNGWLLSHPGAFKLYERELRGIDAALQKGELPGDLTRRQLAYKMGGNEKFFEYGSDGFKLLRAMGADDLIHHRPMPKADMLYHVPRRRKSMKILVTENLDPWLDVRDLMYEDGRSLILGERIHGVVLGGGNPVIENNRISGLLEALGADTIEVLYWGDIDRAGLSLLQRLQVLLDGQYKVTPFMPAYRLMLERAMERYPNPDQNERTTQENVEVADYSELLEPLTEEQAAYFSSIIDNCGLIPQEILTKQDL